MSAALALLRSGVDVEIFEQATEIREVGAGVQISPNGASALAYLDVLDDLLALSCKTDGKEIRLWNSGRTWTLFDLGDEAIELYGFPYVTVFRPDLLTVLSDAVRALKPDALRLGKKCTGCRQSDGKVHLSFVDGSEFVGDGLIGADGVHSQIRTAIFGESVTRFSGLMAWRGVIPMANLPTHMSRMVATNWIGPGAHVVCYPLRRGNLMNFVGIVERSDWQVESWNIRGEAPECHKDFQGWHDDVHTMIANAPTLFKWALLTRPALEQWSDDRITLLGDACHPTLPFLAQGAVMAIEDGVILARCLEFGARRYHRCIQEI